MKCLNCGCELEEGKLYCPKCGYEVQIVPDFEPEIEKTINDAMNGASEDIANHLTLDKEKKQREEQLEQEELQHNRIRLYSTAAAIGMLMIVFAGILFYNRIETVENKLMQAEKAALRGNYAKAIEYTLRAVEKNGQDMDARNLLGMYYLQSGQQKNAVTAFRDIIDLDAENEEAYRNLIGIYEKEQDYEAINELIRASNSSKITNAFVKYIANAPQFNYEQGTYEEILLLKLTANTKGTIYYTLDGSEPNERSAVYTSPISLEDGIHTVRAFFVNEYGIQSESAVQIYQIHLPKAHEPEISLKSGDYTAPQMISVSVPKGEQVYYTIDGSVPTKDSIPYNNPIALPFGSSTYQFISYHEDGAASEVVRREYVFTFQSIVDMPTAVNLLIVGLMQEGIITDTDCSVAGKGGRNLYVCSSAVAINQRCYYLMVEYYRDPSGLDTRTGKLYCVDAENGSLYKAAVGADGAYSVVSF